MDTQTIDSDTHSAVSCLSCGRLCPPRDLDWHEGDLAWCRPCTERSRTITEWDDLGVGD